LDFLLHWRAILRIIRWLLPVFWIHLIFAGDSSPPIDEVFHKIVETAKQNEKRPKPTVSTWIIIKRSSLIAEP
jgi:hypothetical protein